MAILSFILDLTVIALLAAGIYYAIKLEKQLAILRSSRAEMQRYIQEFSLSIARAENGVKNLKETARAAGDDLETLLERSRTMRDDLQFLTGRADQLAEKMSQGPATTTTTATEKAEKPVLRPVAEANAGPTPRSRAERDLLQALQKVSGASE